MLNYSGLLIVYFLAFFWLSDEQVLGLDEPLPAFQSQDSKEAISKFKKRNDEIRALQEQLSKESYEELKTNLKEAMKKSVDKNDNEEVSRISTFLADLDGRGKSAPHSPQNARHPPESKSRSEESSKDIREYRDFMSFIVAKPFEIKASENVLPTQWKFNNDGTWARDGMLVGNWAVIADRTVVVMMKEGKLIDLVEFSEDKKSFQAFHIGSGVKAQIRFNGVRIP
jgi:hypothetical protein